MTKVSKTNTDQKKYQIDEKGSLGVLAYGHVSVTEWKKLKQRKAQTKKG